MWLVQLLRDLACTFHVLSETPKYQYQSKSTGFNLKTSDFFCGFDPLELWVPRGYIILLVFVGYYPISVSMNCIPLITSHCIMNFHIGPGRIWHQPCWIVIPFSDTYSIRRIIKLYLNIYSQIISPLFPLYNNYIRIIYPHWYQHYITIFPNSSWCNSQILSGYISSF